MSRLPIEAVIEAMIEEQGDAWLDALERRDEERNAVVITDSPDHCFRVMHRAGQWVKLEDRLSHSELAAFFAAFGSHWNILLWSWLEASGELVRVRAFIKNGRKAGSGFSISIDTQNNIPLADAEKVA